MKMLLRIALKSLLLVVLLGSALGYIIEQRTGDPLFDQLKAALQQKTKNLSPPAVTLPSLPAFIEARPENTTAYKWADKQGRVHYTDKPPASGEKAQTIEVGSNASVPP